jgi:nicotinamidase-related amidase
MTPSQIEAQRAALLIYDMTQTLVDEGPFFEQWIVDGLPALARLIEGCRRAGVVVCYAVGKDSPAGSEVCHAIAPRPEDIVVVHPHPGAFDDTDLESALRDRGRDTVLIAGMAVDRGANTSARQAMSRGLRPYLVRGVCFTRDIRESPVGPAAKADIERIHLAALYRIGVGIPTVDEVLAAIG